MTRTEQIHARVEELRRQQFELCDYPYTGQDIRELNRELVELRHECEVDGLPFPEPYAHHQSRISEALSRQIALDAIDSLERRHPVPWQQPNGWAETPATRRTIPIYGQPDILRLGRLGVLRIHPDPEVHIPYRPSFGQQPSIDLHKGDAL